VPTDAPYSISDLAGLTGLSVRTIRYYLAQGLIPASGESGPGAHYGEGHLGRLRLVRRLQQQHLPLAEIRTRLASLSDDDVVALESADAPTVDPRQSSALDYVRSVLAGTPPFPPMPATPPVSPAPTAALRAPGAPIPAPTSAPTLARRMLRLGSPHVAEARLELSPAPPMAPPTEPSAATIERSQWERLSLGPNLELHVRRPLSRLEQKRVERLITIARQVLKEEQP
jgi:DNA-binding transcriptional MerR regulator